MCVELHKNGTMIMPLLNIYFECLSVYLFKIFIMFLLVMYLSCAHSSNAMMVMWLNPHCANAALTANVP